MTSSSTNLSIDVTRNRLIWSRIKKLLVVWRERARSRSELRFLTDHDLSDFGVSRGVADHEAAKPFWVE
jgi:uncharacterized protein YjiS (DUF1127 family)